MKAVVLAGGQGTRLRPYTLILPKPLMPVVAMPVIEVLLKWLRRSGISSVYVTIGYLGHLIKALCGDGRQWGMEIAYSEEKEPLGTIGPLLPLRKELDETFLVLNGDLITNLDLRAFARSHRDSGCLVSVATTQKIVQVDLGVIKSLDGRVQEFQEKPAKSYSVSMGVYCMEPAILDHIPAGIPFGFDNLMHHLLENKEPVHVFDHQGLWIDIGREEDFKRSQELLQEHEASIIAG
jgi:mannose-1-phosphate guanylyltransferase